MFFNVYNSCCVLQYTNNYNLTIAYKIMLNLQIAQNILMLASNNCSITAQQIIALLANKSTTFAQINYATNVATSAKHKEINIQKVTSANVQLFSNINAFTSVYTNAVKKTASNIAENNTQAIQQFTAQQTYFTHTTNCYSIVQHNTNNKQYLYAIYNKANSMYFINNVQATKQQVAQYLTASASNKLLNSTNVVHNATNNILHTVQVHTIALSNITQINANAQQLIVNNN